MRKLFATPGMTLFYLGDTLSALGDYVLWLAMGVWVKILTGSTAAAGLTFFAFALGSLCSPLTGVLVDRVRRRPLLIVTYLVTAALVLTLTFVHTGRDVWLVYVVMFLYGISGALTNAAQAALVPQLVRGDVLGEANGVQQTLRQALRLVTPGIGVGTLAWLGGPAVAIVDAVTFLLAVLCLALITVDEQEPVRSESRWRAEVSAGFRYLSSTVILRQLTAAIGVAMLMVGVFESLMYAVVTDGLGHAPTYVGVLVTAQGIGAVLGGLTAAFVLNRTTEGILTVAALGLLTSSSLAFAAHSEIVVIAGSVMLGVALPWSIVGLMTAFQRHTPVELLGRVRGAADVGMTGPQTAGIALGAGLVSAVPYAVLCYVAAGLIGVSAVYLGTRRQQWRSPAPVEAELAVRGQ